MHAEIIAIGDELTSGQRLDTNSQWLASELGRLGAKVTFHTTIGDRLEDNIQAFQIAADRADIVISTGGLGPTADDLTRDAIAAAFHAPLEFRDEAMQHILNLFANRKRPMPERNRVQALFPEGSRLIDNRFGSAPGIDLVVKKANDNESRIFALPGVPAEMKEMYQEVVRPRMIQEMGLGKEQWFYKNLRLFGLGESDVEALIPDLIARQREPIVGITVSKATINLRIATLATNQEDADLKMQATVEEIKTHLSPYIYGADNDEPWDAVVRRLKQKGASLSVHEYGAATVLGPFLTAAAATQESIGTISSVDWSSSRIESTLDRSSDYVLVLGPYPRISNEMTFGGDFRIEIWSGGHLVVEKLQPISGHPDIILQRLAKTGAKALLDWLD